MRGYHQVNKTKQKSKQNKNKTREVILQIPLSSVYLSSKLYLKAKRNYLVVSHDSMLSNFRMERNLYDNDLKTKRAHITSIPSKIFGGKFVRKRNSIWPTKTTIWKFYPICLNCQDPTA